jgi:hypothetical protein
VQAAKLGGTAGIPSRPYVGREFLLSDENKEQGRENRKEKRTTRKETTHYSLISTLFSPMEAAC